MTVFTDLIQPDHGQDAIPIHIVDKDNFEQWLTSLTTAQRGAIAANTFTGAVNNSIILANGDGWIAALGVADRNALGPYCLAKLADTLPAGTYRLVDANAGAALFGWAIAQHHFDRYQSDKKEVGPRVLLTKEVKAIATVTAEAAAEALIRDMVNTPAQDMGPAEIEAEAAKIAKRYDAEIHVTMGDMLETEYPMVHAVGRAAARSHAPRMIRIEWGKADAPRLAIIGKGVAFDSGGLDIKPSSGMLIMKKDMGGAAHALALADLVMGAAVNVRLQVLVPAVENAIAGNAFRPGDVLTSRKGLTVEITNTDAEGRLILGDALARASEDKPDLIIDFATLTGAARIALGPDLPAMMARRDTTADELVTSGRAHHDEIWRLPLPDAYREWLHSDIADMVNSHSGSFAGASVAGLFLDRFVDEGLDWVHFDTFAWRPSAKPGRPKGGAGYGVRAAFHMIKARFGGA